MDDNLPLTPEQEAAIEASGCCGSSAIFGAHRCVCWEVVYDLEQAAVDDTAQPGQRADMCADCAYRPDSPERNGDPNQVGSEPGELDDIARGSVFWCHQGIRRKVAMRHPTLGFVVEPVGVGYDPPIVSGVPFKADGSPGDRCAGWAARRRQLLAAETERPE
jgi:hypothetical protein